MYAKKTFIVEHNERCDAFTFPFRTLEQAISFRDRLHEATGKLFDEITAGNLTGSAMLNDIAIIRTDGETQQQMHQFSDQRPEGPRWFDEEPAY